MGLFFVVRISPVFDPGLCIGNRKKCSLRHSSLSLPLKLSMKVLSEGFPGRVRTRAASFVISSDVGRLPIRSVIFQLIVAI